MEVLTYLFNELSDDAVAKILFCICLKTASLPEKKALLKIDALHGVNIYVSLKLN